MSAILRVERALSATKRAREKTALWRIYILGRRGIEKELGLVIGPSDHLRWLASCPTIAADMVRTVNGASGLLE